MATTSMAARLPEERPELHMGELKPPYDRMGAVAEANRCLYCHDAPCMQHCPTHIDIPGFIRKIAVDNLPGAARTILTANILGLSCAMVCPVEVLCEGACVYHWQDRPPIAIGKLQRYATEHAYDQGLRFFEAGPESGAVVGLIGAGPASLACAHEVRLMGHRAVILEGRDLPGGLNTTGVAPYKMLSDDALKEVEYILEIGGIELRTGVWAGSDGATYGDLSQEFDALFLGVGLGPDRRLPIPGDELAGVMGAVELIEQLKNTEGPNLGGVEDAAVVGGGNTAIDAVRELKALGIPRVTLIYRRDANRMSGYQHEQVYARKEGVSFEYLAQPIAFEAGADGRVGAVRCQRMRLGSPGEGGRRPLEPVEGETFSVPARLVAQAIGQQGPSEFLNWVPGLAFDGSRVKVAPTTGATSVEGVFAGGDCANGGKEVVNAAAEGKIAARGIDAWLRSRVEG